MNFKINRALFRVISAFLILCLAVTFFSGCDKPDVEENPMEEYDADKMIYIKEDDLIDTEFIEAKYMGDEVTKTFCDTKVTAVYDKTIYKPIGDFKEVRYKITALERNGISEEVSENDYIGFDTAGNVIRFTPKIYPGKFKVQRDGSNYSLEAPDGTKWQAEQLVFKDMNAVRSAVEKLLGDIANWDTYYLFGAKLNRDVFNDKFTSITFLWTQGKNGGFENRQTDHFVTCELYFASNNMITGEYELFEEPFISSMCINSPFGDKKITREYIDKYYPLSLYTDPPQKWLSRWLEKEGYHVTYIPNAFLTVFNGKICRFAIYDAEKDFNTTTYYWIYPLE